MSHGIGAVAKTVNSRNKLQREDEKEEHAHVQISEIQQAMTAKKTDDDAMAAMRKRMEVHNKIGIIEEKKKSFYEELKANFKLPKLNVKSAKFKESKFSVTGKETEYDIRSLWIIHGNWWIRKKIVWLIEWQQFENFMTINILANSIMLACTDYSDREYPEGQYISIPNLNMDVVNNAFTIIFLFEAVSKILGMGFIMHKNSYMRDRWNWLDILVVSISVIGWLPGIGSNSSFKSLRTFRILRPLRSISAIPTMKALIQSLLASLPGLANVGVFLIFMFCIFAIFGTQQFAGSQYNRCRMTPRTNLTLVPDTTDQYYWPINFNAIWLCSQDSDCQKQLQGKDGDNGVYVCGSPDDVGLQIETDQLQIDYTVFFNIPNFDNLLRSWSLIFQNVTMEGWTLLMYNFMDCNNYWIAAIYQCSTIIVFSFFTMQLILAQIMETFANEQQRRMQMMSEDVQEAETKAELANMFVTGLKGQNEKHQSIEKSQNELQQSHQESSNVQDKFNFQENALIELGFLGSNIDLNNVNKNQQKSPQNENKNKPKLELSDADLDVDKQKLEGWVTNKKEQFPVEENLKQEKELDSDVDSEDQYEGETKYEIKSRERSKKNFVLRKIYKLVNSPTYNFAVFILIIGNTVALAMDDYPQSFKKQAVLSVLNDFFTWAFTAEMLMKILGLGLNNYVHDNFNLFDAIVVSFSILDWILNHTLSDAEMSQIGSGMKAIRALRLLRIIKIARQWEYLLYIISTIVKSVKDILNFGVLFFLFLYIFALLGMQMFSHQTKIEWSSTMTNNVVPPIQSISDTRINQQQLGVIVISPHYNFDNIYNSLIVCFCNTMAEDWNNAMYVFALSPNQSQPLTMVYFMLLFYGGNSIMLALFTAILLQNFEESEEQIQAKEMKQAKKEKFNWRSMFTFGFLVKIKNAIIGTFDPKGSKRKGENQVQQNTPQPGSVDQIKFQASKKQEALKQLGLSIAMAPPRTVISRINLLHYELNEKALGVKKVEKSIIDDIELEGQSLFCFGPNNSFRIACFAVANNTRYFQNFILILILISTLCLAINSPLTDPNGQLSNVLNYIDFVMTGFFICEMLTKWVAYGFAFSGKNSYIRSAWNILDFIIVISATISVVFQSINIAFIKSLRVLRVLRPLRLIAKHKGLKLAVSALINSIPSITNLLLIVVFFIFLLAILTVTLFSGQLWSCTMTQLTNTSTYIQAFGVTNRYTCLMYGGEWINNDYNFDTVIQAILTLISIQSTENWVNEMWYVQDSIAPEVQPYIGSNLIFDVYSIIQQMFLTLLCLNLFVGVVLDSYNLEKDKLSLNYLLQKIESMWIDNLKLCYSAKPMITTPKTKDKIRNHFIDLCDSSIFQNLILCCIIGNTVALCIKWHQMPQSMSSQLESVNLIFAVIFTIEAIFKIYAYRRNYFRDNWNRFDFSVVLLTWVVQILISTKLPFDVSILGMIARTLRIGRVFRLVKRIKAIQVILQTLVEALPGISAIALLLFLIFFLYAIIGMSQFPFVMWSYKNVYNDQLNLHYNFQDFVTAFLALFRNSTGEAWDSGMFDAARPYSIIYQCNSNADWYSYMNNGQFADGCGLGVIAIIYFYSFYIIAVQIFLNMFIAVIIDAFMDQSQALGMPVNQADVDDFIECWQIFDPNGDGAIQCEDLEKFVVRLAQTKSKIIQNRKRILKSITIRRKYLASLEIPCHQNFRKFLFVDVIQCMSKLVIEQQYIKQEFAEQKQQLTLHHKKVKGQIETDEQNHQDLIKIIEMNKLRNHKQEFKDFVSGISLKSSDILSVSELKSAASKISSAKLEKIDINEIDEDNHEVYTSKHYVYGDLIVNCWRDFLEAKAQEINDSNQSKQAQINEEQQKAKTILENAPIQQ